MNPLNKSLRGSSALAVVPALDRRAQTLIGSVLSSPSIATLFAAFSFTRWVHPTRSSRLALKTDSCASPPSMFVLAGLASLFAGCYGAAPRALHRPQVPSGGALLTVATQETSYVETTRKTDSICASTGLPVFGASACLSADYDVDRQVSRQQTTASLGDLPLSYEQFLVLTDERYDHKLQLLDDHRDACRKSAVPEYAGIGLGIGGLLVAGTAEKDSGMRTAGWVALGAGVATYLAGYVALGGDRCEEGRRLFNRLDHSSYREVMTVDGATRAREMQSVADQFNRRQNTSQESSPSCGSRCRTLPVSVSFRSPRSQEVAAHE